MRIWREGAPVLGRVRETVYAFDQPVIPAGSEARGQVTSIAPVPKLQRTMAIANADFSPPHRYTVTFDTIILSDGRQLAVQTTVAPGIAEVVHLVSNPARAARKKNAATQAVDSAKQEVHDKFHQAMAEIKSPGRLHRIKQFLLAQLPFRRQYLEPGTRFDADLEKPLDFGVTSRTPRQLSSIGAGTAAESTLRARLAGEISSATAQRGTPIVAVVTDPVFTPEHQLVLPANSRIIGEVTEVRPARKLHHNGNLRIVFERITTPEGRMLAMQGNLEGVEVNRAANLKLDTEGGAHATDSKSRYLTTALAISIAAVAGHPESDNGAPDGMADPAARTAAGGSGFKLVGAAVSLASGSRAFSSMLGFYGASMSVYNHFLARGKDVVFPKDTPLEIGLGQPQGGKARNGTN